MRSVKTFTQIALPLVLLIVIALACGGGKPVAEMYQGEWEAVSQGQVGSTIYMHADGKAGFKLPGKEVDGGGAEIDDNAKTLTIALMGISHTWKIVAEPNEKGEMILSDAGKAEGGTVFRRK